MTNDKARRKVLTDILVGQALANAIWECAKHDIAIPDFTDEDAEIVHKAVVVLDKHAKIIKEKQNNEY